MDVRITPFSNFSSLTKTSRKNNPLAVRDKFNLLNRNKIQLNKLRSEKPSTAKTQFTVSKSSLLSVPAKKLRSANNALLVLFNKKNNPDRMPIKITSARIQPPTIAEKKGVLLYQQLERNNFYSNGTGLINRFNFKV